MRFCTRDKSWEKTGGGKGEGRENLLPKLIGAFFHDDGYIYTGREAVPPDVTRVRIDESLTVIPVHAFYGNRNIEEVECHDRVKTVEQGAFNRCRSLRIVIMPGVEVVEWRAFYYCEALTDVECDKLEIIGISAFDGCESLTSIDLPSAKIVEGWAFAGYSPDERQIWYGIGINQRRDILSLQISGTNHHPIER
eukprot:scaffold8675_cov75-Skeletonema_marinoi.AAC.4